MISLYRFFVLLLSTLLVFSLFTHGTASPIPDDLAPKHAGPSQFGSQHIGPSRPSHLGPPRGHVGPPKPEISLYGHS